MVNRSSRKTVLLVLLVFGMVFAFGGVSLAATLTVGPGDSYDYKSIQDAVDNANSEDEIEVYAGTYNGDIVIPSGKNNLVLRSVSGPDMTEIRGDTALNVIFVNSNLGITIEGFKITPGSFADTGIYFDPDGGDPEDPVTITSCVFEGFESYGIDAYWIAMFNTTFTVTDNIFTDCDYGIFAYGFEDCTVNISGNRFENCPSYGMELGSMGNNASTVDVRVTDNEIVAESGSDCYAGIYIENVEGETEISDNTITGDLEYGIFISKIGERGGNRVSAFIEKNEISVDGTGMNLGDLFGLVSGDLTVRYNTIETNANNNEISGIYVDTFNDADSTVSFRDNNLIGDTGVKSWGFATMATVLIDAQGNWWGDASGPFDDHDTSSELPDYNNPEGLGKNVTSYIDYANWRTTAWEEEDDDSSSGCNAGVLNPLFLLLLAPMGLLLKKSR
jgi:Synergist-CTERM protein sorting domain-containing protein